MHRIASALLLLLVSLPVLALNLQLKPSVHAEVEYDNNIFRAPDAPPTGTAPRVDDTLTRLGGGVRLVLRESLQELELQGEAEHVDYARLDSLDYDRYRVGATTQLAYASLVKLKLEAGRERRQESFAYRDDTQNGLITIDQVRAELRLAITPAWAAVAGGTHYSTEASREASQDYDFTENAGELGIEYARNDRGAIALAARLAEGEFPRRVVVAGDGREKDYHQQGLLLRGSYRFSGLSEVSSQLAYTRRRHADASVPDFNGITGRATYTRRLSGLSRVRLEVYRDLFYVEDVNANYVENLGGRATLDYSLSSKLALIVGMERYESSYKGSPGFDVEGDSRKDQVYNVRLGADYRPFYRFSMLPEVRYERRGSNLADSAYDFTVVTLDLAYEYGLRNRRP